MKNMKEEMLKLLLMGVEMSTKGNKISWGVDSNGNRHYLCNYCELVFGIVDIKEIKHKCDLTKPRYHNRDKKGSINETLPNM